MSTTTVNVAVNTSQATNNLNKLNKQVNDLGKSFGALRNVIGGLAIGTLITNVLRSADAMDDLANATGFTIAEINGLSSAFAANGGEAQSAESAVTRFANSLDDAKNGSAKAQSSFAKLGIDLQDLATLSQQDLFRETIQGLGEMPAGAERTALAMELLGKNVRTVDFTGVNDSLDGFIAQSKKAEPGIKNAAQLFDNLRAIGRETTNNLFADSTTLGGALKDLTSNVKAIADSLSKVITLIGIFGAAFGLLKLGDVINKLTALNASIKTGGGIIQTYEKGVKNLKAGFEQLLTVFGLGSLASKKYTGGLLLLFDVIANIGRAFLKFGNIALLIYGVGQAFAYMFNTANPVQKVLEFIGDAVIVLLAQLKRLYDFIMGYVAVAFKYVGDLIYNAFQGPLDWLAEKFNIVRSEWNKLVNDSKVALGFEVDKVETPEVEQPETDTSAIVDAQETLKKSIYDVNVQYAMQYKQLQENLEAQLRYNQVSEDEAEILKAQEDIRQKSADSIARLVEIKEGLKDTEKDLIPIIDKQIESINLQRDAQIEAVAANIKALQDYKNAQDEVMKKTELMKLQLTDDAAIKSLRDQIALLQLYGDELENANIALEVSQSLEQSLLEFRKQELDLLARKGQLTDEQFQREMEQIEALRQAAYKRAGDEIDARTEVKQAQRAADEDANLGIKKYIDELEKSTTPAKRALESVQSVFNNMDNALETFVREGKFKFKDFALSVIQDLLLIQAKAAMVALFKSILGSIGIPGLAEGGPAVAGKPYIIGEKGPELFVPKQSGTVIPNDEMTAKGKGTGMVNAPITNNYITNNISALDAKSVAQLFAENRKALLGSVRTAEKELPYRA